MQIDMHYYGTYAMARAAGVEPDAARIIATASQFVDDNTARRHVEFRDGARIDQEATAHHTFDRSNVNHRDQRRVWVPFHFMPGGFGDTYTERLKCRKDSEIVQEMIDHHLTYSDRSFALHLLGIAAHVYGDTFSHYGFSGVSSRGNKVDNSSFRYHEEVEGAGENIEKLQSTMRSYINNKLRNFLGNVRDNGVIFPNIKGWLAENASGALGHGTVATLPDRPYLVWSFDYEQEDAVDGKCSIRNNPVTYLEGCQALHAMFTRFVEKQPDCGSGDRREFENIASRVRGVLLVQADKAGRVEAWQKAARSGEIFGEAEETIPGYDGEKWNEDWDSLDGREASSDAMDLPVWRFYQAAAIHRTYVLRDLLPKRGLIVD